MASVEELCNDLDTKMESLKSSRQSRRDQWESALGGIEEGPAVIKSGSGDASILVESTIPPAGGSAPNATEKAHADGQDIYLGNLPKGTSQEELMEFFKKVNPIRARVLSHGGEGSSYGFVRLPNMDKAKDAVRLVEGIEINGHLVKVSIVRDRSRARIMEEGILKGLELTEQQYRQMTLHVSNIPVDTTEDDIKAMFKDFGGVAKIILSATKDARRQYARVTLRSEALVKQALQALPGTIIQENRISFARFGYNPRQHLALMGHKSHPSGVSYNSMANNAKRLAQKIDVLSMEILCPCDFCQRISCLIKELQATLDKM